MAWGKSEQKQDMTPPVLHPVDRARAAFENGERFFQTQLIVNEMAVFNPSLSKIDNAMHETEGVTGILSDIESIGWHLEHVGYTFMEKAARSFSGQAVTNKWTAGHTIGIYLFRRAQA